jgi:hypothetical protein
MPSEPLQKGLFARTWISVSSAHRDGHWGGLRLLQGSASPEWPLTHYIFVPKSLVVARRFALHGLLPRSCSLQLPRHGFSLSLFQGIEVTLGSSVNSMTF